MAHGDFKDLPKRTMDDKVLRDKTFNSTKNKKYDTINVGLLQWFINFLIRCIQVVLLKVKLCQTNNLLKNYTKQLLENLKNEKRSHLLKIIFGVLILQICN